MAIAKQQIYLSLFVPEQKPHSMKIGMNVEQDKQNITKHSAMVLFNHDTIK